MRENNTQNTINWLLEKEDPSVRYFTLKYLLDREDQDSEVLQARSDIMSSKPVTELLKDQNKEGFWNDSKSYMTRFTGTFWHFLLLVELGVEPECPNVQKAAEYLLNYGYSYQQHAFTNEIHSEGVPCYNGYFLWAMLKCGFYHAPEIQDCIQGIIDHMQFNDGDTEVSDPFNGCIGKHTCIRGAVPILRAFSELVKINNNPSVLKVINDGKEFLLKHYLYKRSHDLKKTINPRLTRLTFPCFYYTDILQMLDVLLALDCRDARMEEAYRVILKKQNLDGRWKLDRLFHERGKEDIFPAPITLGERGTENKWITLKALQVIKKYSERA